VLTCSALKNTGISEIWGMIMEYERMMKSQGFFTKNREDQNLQWMHDVIHYHLMQHFYHSHEVKHHLSHLERQVASGKLPATAGAKKILDRFLGRNKY
jgi:LAO/AO transport system kinase